VSDDKCIQNVFKFPEGNTPFDRLVHGCDDNIKINLKTRM
jgi:hypothetical protein